MDRRFEFISDRENESTATPRARDQGFSRQSRCADYEVSSPTCGFDIDQEVRARDCTSPPLRTIFVFDARQWQDTRSTHDIRRRVSTRAQQGLRDVKLLGTAREFQTRATRRDQRIMVFARFFGD